MVSPARAAAIVVVLNLVSLPIALVLGLLITAAKSHPMYGAIGGCGTLGLGLLIGGWLVGRRGGMWTPLPQVFRIAGLGALLAALAIAFLAR